MTSFEHNFSTFDKHKTSNDDDEKPVNFLNPNEDKTKKGLQDLTNILKSSKPTIPLKNTKKNSNADTEPRIFLEISNIHYEITNKLKNVRIKFIFNVFLAKKHFFLLEPISLSAKCFI